MIRRFVIDASVAVKWLLPEDGSEQALDLLEAGHELCAPDLLVSEIGNVLWKKSRTGAIPAEAAQRLMEAFLNLSIRLVESTHIAALALDIARRYDRSYYDSLYLALAQATGGMLVTADARFANALATTPMAKQIVTLDTMVLTSRQKT